jgi:hypothetical protein
MRGLTAPPRSHHRDHRSPGAGRAGRPVDPAVRPQPDNRLNDTGKSILLDLLASPAGHGAARERHWHGELLADIQWFDPQQHTLQLRARDGQLGFRLDGAPAPFLPAPYRPVYLRTGGGGC